MQYNLNIVAVISLLYLSWYHINLLIDLILLCFSLFLLSTTLIAIYAVYKLKQFDDEKRNLVLTLTMNTIKVLIQGILPYDSMYDLYQLITS